MNCNKNGIKKEGESCTLNNNCIYPNCMNNMTNQERKEYNINCANFLNWIYVSSIDLKENKYPQLNEAGWYKFIPKVAHAKLHYSYYIGRSNHDLKFDSDWNYINLVLDKIAKLDYGWKVTSKYVNIYSHIGDPKGDFDCKHSTNCPTDVKLDTIRTINQFLIWYNKNK